ncbi:MAG: HEAT repeat domain-containing protein [Myxococcota bacterium]
MSLESRLMSIAERSADEAMVLLRAVETKLGVCGREEAVTIASLLPVRHDAVEVRAGLARLTLRLAAYAPKSPAEDDEPALRPLWDRCQLAVTPALAAKWSDERVIAALASAVPKAMPTPGPLVRRLAACAGDEAYLAIAWAKAAVTALSLSPNDAFEALQALSRNESDEVRAAFVRELRQPWLSRVASRSAIGHALEDSCPHVVREALLSGSRHHVQRARALLRDPHVAHAATHLLACFGDAADLEQALHHPDAMLIHHRSGRFPRAEHVESLLQSFLAQSWTGFAFAQVTFTCRQEVLDQLAAVEETDLRWERLAELLPHLEGRSSSGKTATDLLNSLLSTATNADVVAALLEAARSAPGVSENALLPHVDAFRELALAALRVHGGPSTLRTIGERLREPTAFGASRREALDLCWALADDRFALVDAIGAEPWSDAQLKQLVTKAETRVSRVLREGSAVVRLRLLANVGDVAHLKSVATLFRRAIRDARAFDASRRPNPQAATLAEEALLIHEKRLRTLGRRFTPFGDDDGEGALVRRVVLEWLEEPERDEELVWALEILQRYPLTRTQLRHVHRLWRHPNPAVKRAATEALIACEHADGLALSLSRLAAEDDLRVLRQGLRAIARFEAEWAEPLAVAALESPNMNVKKTAAEALVAVGTSASVAALCGWIARHDNPGFRETLLEALDQVCGESANAMLVAQAAQALTSPLLDSLAGRLRVLDVARLAMRGDAALPAAVRKGELRLADGDWEDVARLLHEGTDTSSSAASAVDELRIRGFSPERAHAALDEDDPKLLDAIRARLPEWSHWAAYEAPSALAPRASHCVLLANGDLIPEEALVHVGRAESPEESRAAFSALRRLGTDGPQWRQRAIEAARRLPSPHGPQRLRTLRGLGATIIRPDVEAALRDVRWVRGEAALLAEYVIDPALQDDVRRYRSLTEDERGALLEAFFLPNVERPLRLVDAVSSSLGDATETLADVLASKLDLPTAHRERVVLAQALREWPDAPERILPLLPLVPRYRLRNWSALWVTRFREGDRIARAALGVLKQEEILELAEALGPAAEGLAVKASPGDLVLAAQMMANRFGTALPSTSLPRPPEDPLDDLHDEASLLVYAKKARDRDASRAVRRLGELGALDALLELAAHRDANPRTVALRWIRKVAPRSVYHATCLARLRTEPDTQLRRQLVRSLSAYEPAFPRLAELTLDRDQRVARAAVAVLKRSGESARSAVEQMLRKARPDHRRKLEALLAELDP